MLFGVCQRKRVANEIDLIVMFVCTFSFDELHHLVCSVKFPFDDFTLFHT